MDIMDISYIDVNELGVRPLNWLETENDLDFDDISNDYFGKGKLDDFSTFFSGEKLINNEDNTLIVDDDEDDSNYEIDPETGMWRFCLNDLSQQREKQVSVLDSFTSLFIDLEKSSFLYFSLF